MHRIVSTWSGRGAALRCARSRGTQSGRGAALRCARSRGTRSGRGAALRCARSRSVAGAAEPEIGGRQVAGANWARSGAVLTDSASP
ncbi:hypothetical protein FTUN_5024 [Frigoriglobus tundricola]|uniref:Uncharacterized protein n=1 Tax=Frigoriglobus tundricola TaxID=2774151 RepID=A0A6M5YVC6_9BACT|nr:hypothetical protein FTUN_5024 [Frigoriglobus tundricola]